ncbi:uncharacterized protein BXZ73DRAFT_46315 [Epithele typhae]|uniref:uncharacterized protein n=1 Tax=Epithele typhae TaxID=378194 RepID=UPI002007EC07|nr:uncharacterized protein BXZ73DRAFT_46315 [Epithele typhae]KAH9933642.1 hypothetical protein BXZ73DRAFT_46315 [Epithele typhae]
MATAAQPLAERADIHKSCKTLETAVNVLNDYCEAANAIVLLQKKLAKALREVASAKCVADIPANALNTSATIFEAMTEVDTKFAKFADKECDSVSSEVKKWFKKLAKEERVHDEKIASANLKLKQAGQLYERKAKKNPREAADEHTRYINLLSALGPEVNREKYNHALLVTQRHTATMYNLASSFSRVADSEWVRSCESVRRFSPTVGQLGQWRALCEGGWQGSMPPDLPGGASVDQSDTTSQAPVGNEQDLPPSSDGIRQLANALSEKGVPDYSSRNASEQEPTSRAVTPSGQSPMPPPQYFPSPTDPAPLPRASAPSPVSASQERESPREDSSKSAESAQTSARTTTLANLAAFPAPPTHVPTPRAGGSRFNSVASPPPQEVRSDSQEQDDSLTPFPRMESPLPESAGRTPNLTEDSVSLPSSRTELITPDVSSAPLPDTMPEDSKPPRDEDRSAPPSSYSHASRSDQDPESPSPDLISSPRPGLPASSSYRRGDYIDEAEFGVRRGIDAPRSRAPLSNEPPLAKIVERTDTGRSTGSMVAALRDRYSMQPEQTSPPPKSPGPRELPKVPNNVSSLATRYESTSPSRQPDSPTQRRTSADSYHRLPEPSTTTTLPSVSRYSTSQPVPSMDEIALRRQRIDELEELELRERTHQLRMKEREIEMRTRELERERMEILNTRARGSTDGYLSDGGRSVGQPRVSTAQRASMDRYPSSYSQSVTHLALPPVSRSSAAQSSSSQPSSPADHAPYCGCEMCSASKYKARDPSSPRDTRPPEPPIQLRPEKPKGGWIRRLSMPVINNTFSLDTKKGVSSVGIAGGLGAPSYRNSLAFPDEDGRIRTDITVTGGIRNRSTSNVARR